MKNNSEHAGRRRSIIVAAASVVLALLGAVVVLMGIHASSGPPQPTLGASRSEPASAPPSSSVSSGTSGGVDTRQAKGADLGPVLTASRPVAIEIPSIGVRTGRFVDLGRAGDGSLQVPKDFSAVGWYAQGSSPGQLGSAVLAGHVDGRNGPAIFYRLGALRPGAAVRVGRKDGSTATFSVDRIQRFSKDRFPTELVYGSTSRAELRLITCGGSFDRTSGHYVDNVVAFAHLVR
ncbi:MAG: hypothetical protein QOF35_1563 [Actinomycetota bacterium]|nr:hypothetical protein [Actinomycetota bacterium]